MKYSTKSKEILSTLSKDAQAICNRAIVITEVDFALVFGHRTPALQFLFFQQGRREIDGVWEIVEKGKVVTYKDGYNKLSKHNIDPSPAWDIRACIPGKKHLSYDTKVLSFLAGVFITVARELYARGAIDHLVRWGGNWDMDGEIITDQGFQDLCHFELYKP